MTATRSVSIWAERSFSAIRGQELDQVVNGVARSAGGRCAREVGMAAK